MPRYEYKVVPAPTRGLKGKGVKGAEARFSHALQELMNGLAGYGWEYQRAETLPSIERSGLASTTTEWRNVLVFRRLRETGTEAFAPELLPSPDTTAPAPEAAPAAPQETPKDAPSPAGATAPDQSAASTPTEASEAGTDTTSDTDTTSETEEDVDNGVENTSDVKTTPSAIKSLFDKRKSLKSGD